VGAVATLADAVASSPPLRGALACIARAARAALAPAPAPPAAAEAAALLRQDAAHFAALAGGVRRQAAAAGEAARLAAAWPAAEVEEREARRAAMQARRAVEDAELDGGAASDEAVRRADERRARATRALAAVEALRRDARALAEAAAAAVGAGADGADGGGGGGGGECGGACVCDDGAPEAAALVASMSPPAPARAPATDFDALWARLRDSGLAGPFSPSDYERLEPLPAASGSMSVVLGGWLRGGGERVVLKEFSTSSLGNVRLFEAEIRALSRLHHANIIAFDGVLRDELHVYIRFPHVEGGSLRQWLAAAPRAAPARLRVAAGVAAALACVHAGGLVHRDLKPENVLVAGDGEAKLADFGISCAATRGGGGGATTLAAAPGTPAYASPEQLRGERASPASDVYALGLLLHELLFDAPYGLPPAARAAAGAPPAPLPASPPRALALPRAADEAARQLLPRLLAPAAADRPTAAEVLDSALLRLARGAGAGGAERARARDLPPEHSAVVAARRRLAALPAAAEYDLDLVRGAGLWRAFADGVARALAMEAQAAGDRGAGAGAAAAAGGGAGAGGDAERARTWRLRLWLRAAADDGEGDGGAISAAADTERALDAALAAAMAGGAGIFATAVPHDDAGGGDLAGVGAVLPAPTAPADDLVAVGALLAQAALAGAEAVDAVARLPPILLDAAVRGPEAALDALCVPSAAFAALEQFDSHKAAQFRGIMQGAAADFGLELPGWRGVAEPVTDANKADLLRRHCAHTLVRSRFAALQLLHRGFLAAGGAAVRDAMAAGAGGALTLRPLIFDANARARRRRSAARHREEDAASLAAISADSKPCPGCGTMTFRYAACMHLVCTVPRCGAAWNWCCARVNREHPPFSCPLGFPVDVVPGIG
jgi:hypothetical protein